MHHMQVRITINESLEIVDAAAVTLHGPYAICPKGAENITGLIGLKIGAGWKHKVKTAIGGAHGCPYHKIAGAYGDHCLPDSIWRDCAANESRQKQA